VGVKGADSYAATGRSAHHADVLLKLFLKKGSVNQKTSNNEVD